MLHYHAQSYPGQPIRQRLYSMKRATIFCCGAWPSGHTNWNTLSYLIWLIGGLFFISETNGQSRTLGGTVQVTTINAAAATRWGYGRCFIHFLLTFYPSKITNVTNQLFCKKVLIKGIGRKSKLGMKSPKYFMEFCFCGYLVITCFLYWRSCGSRLSADLALSKYSKEQLLYFMDVAFGYPDKIKKWDKKIVVTIVGSYNKAEMVL